MKFAFLIMGNFDPAKDSAAIGSDTAQIIGVSSIRQACEVAETLIESGIDCIELCGAFQEEGARKIMKTVGDQAAVGYVVHLPEEDEKFRRLFPEE